MREKLKQFYIVLLVFILTIMGQYGHVLQTEAVFSTQKETVSAKSQTGKRLTGQKSEEKVYASGISQQSSNLYAYCRKMEKKKWC